MQIHHILKNQHWRNREFHLCEFDGGLGHGKAIHGASTKTLEDSIKIDKLKDRYLLFFHNQDK